MERWRTAKAKAAAKLRIPPVKYGLITLALALWGFGLADQLDSWAAAMKYLAVSALIVAVAVI